MVSVFPPVYGLVSIFNISENSILEIIETGYSESFHKKADFLLNKYNNAIGIDEDKIKFVKKLHQRCLDLNKEEGYAKYNYDIELQKIIGFLTDYINAPKTYFSDYVIKGRALRKQSKAAYRRHKMMCVSYTPFGVFEDRRNTSFKKSSNFLYFDIDEKLTFIEKKKLIKFFVQNSYIKASWLSFSKDGFGFIVKSNWSSEKQMKKIYYKLVEYFTLQLKALGFNKRLFDTQVCSLSRMNFLSNGMIKNKIIFKEFAISDYSDELFTKLHSIYKQNSKKDLPDRPLTEDSVTYLKNKKPRSSRDIDDKEHLVFLRNITKNVSFSGSDDFNTCIKTYIGTVFRYRLDDYLVENYLFENIPYTTKTFKTFDRMWKSFSNYNSFQTVNPFEYN